MSVEVIIVNYRSTGVLSRCLEALSVQSQAHQVQIVDNSPEEGNLKALAARFPGVAVIEMPRNVGFAHAVNVAVSRSSAEVVVTLNPDTLPAPDFVEEISRPFATDGTLGAVAGTLCFETRPDTIASAGIAVHSNGVAIDYKLGEGHNRQTPLQPVFGASGGAAAYRRSAFREAGGFPEMFFMYLEDVDLAWRLRLNGHQCIWNPAATVLHAYSSSAREGSEFKRRLLARNRIWTLVRCLPAELWRRDAARIASFDALTFGFNVATLDLAAASGRVAAIAGMGARLAERRMIQSNRQQDVHDIDTWVKPAISPATLRRLRRLTAELAAPVN